MNQQIPDTEGISSSLPSKDTPSSRRPDSPKQTPEVHQTINCPSVPRGLTPHQQHSSTGSAAADCCRLQRLGRHKTDTKMKFFGLNSQVVQSCLIPPLTQQDPDTAFSFRKRKTKLLIPDIYRDLLPLLTLSLSPESFPHPVSVLQPVLSPCCPQD